MAKRRGDLPEAAISSQIGNEPNDFLWTQSLLEGRWAAEGWRVLRLEGL